MNVYFNELDPVACAVLREAHEGHVDERSIKDVSPGDVGPFRIAHFFAGAGLWEVARRLARWPDDLELWTASCPCQPFSAAGKRLGTDDPRHLWPDLYRLVCACQPARIVGEQVAGAAGYAWFDGVRADLEREGYSCRAVDIPALAVDAPQQRNRLYWIAVGDADREREQQSGWNLGEGRGWSRHATSASDRARADRGGHDGRPEDALGLTVERDAVERAYDGALVRSERAGLEGHARHGDNWRGPGWSHADPSRPTAETDVSVWREYEWIICGDGKARRAKPGIRLLVDGMAGRADLWRLAGNSIVPQLAAQVLSALLETI